MNEDEYAANMKAKKTAAVARGDQLMAKFRSVPKDEALTAIGQMAGFGYSATIGIIQGMEEFLIQKGGRLDENAMQAIIDTLLEAVMANNAMTAGILAVIDTHFPDAQEEDSAHITAILDDMIAELRKGMTPHEPE